MSSISEHELNAFLSQPLIARLATVRADGRPHVAPVWYMWEDGTLYIETAYNSVKGRNILRDPRCAVTIDVTGGGMRNKHVIIEGEAETIQEHEEVQSLARRIYVRYLGHESLDTPSVKEMLAGNIFILRIRPRNIAHSDTMEITNLGVLS